MSDSRTADLAELLRRRQHWRSLRLQYRSGYQDGLAGRRYQPYPTRYFNQGYWNGFVEGRARRNRQKSTPEIKTARALMNDEISLDRAQAEINARRVSEAINGKRKGI